MDKSLKIEITRLFVEFIAIPVIMWVGLSVSDLNTQIKIVVSQIVRHDKQIERIEQKLWN